MNTNNIIKLIKAYFYENWQKDLIYNFLIVLAIGLFSVLSSPFDTGVATFAAVFLIIYYPCRLFSKMQQPSSRMHYLMVPASNSEKVVTGMLLVNIYYVLGIVLSEVIGVLLGYGILSVVHQGTVSIMDGITLGKMLGVGPQQYGLSILMVYTSIAVMFFAAIYFKKSPFWKLLLTGFVISLVLGAIMACTDWLNVLMAVPAEIRNGNYVKVEHYVTTSSNWFPYVACCVAMVYFYAMSFLRMRETEA